MWYRHRLSMIDKDVLCQTPIHTQQSVANIQIFEYIHKYSLQIIFILVFAVKKITNIIHICSRLGIWILFVFVFVQEKNICYTPIYLLKEEEKKEWRIFFYIYLNQQSGKLQNVFDIISTIFRLVGSTNLGLDYFLILEYIQMFKYICEYFYE